MEEFSKNPKLTEEFRKLILMILILQYLTENQRYINPWNQPGMMRI